MINYIKDLKLLVKRWVFCSKSLTSQMWLKLSQNLSSWCLSHPFGLNQSLKGPMQGFSAAFVKTRIGGCPPGFTLCAFHILGHHKDFFLSMSFTRCAFTWHKNKYFSCHFLWVLIWLLLLELEPEKVFISILSEINSQTFRFQTFWELYHSESGTGVL